MTTKHTPGPWRLNGESGLPGQRVWGSECRLIATLHRQDDTELAPPDEESAANGRLILDAPELLRQLGVTETELSEWIEDPKIPQKIAKSMRDRLQAIRKLTERTRAEKETA